MDILQKNRVIVDYENSKNLLESELEEIKKNIEIAMKKRKSRLGYEQLREMESFFDYYNRETVGGIAVEMFRQIENMVRQLNCLEEKFLREQEKNEQYSVNIEEMNKEIEVLTLENERIAE